MLGLHIATSRVVLGSTETFTFEWRTRVVRRFPAPPLMHLVLALLIVAQQGSVTIGAGRQKSDSVRRARRDSIRTSVMVAREIGRAEGRRTPRRIPLTPELERSAFKDAQARQLLLDARAARLRQDSTLLSYDATTHQRMSVGIGIRAIGRNRTLWRSETVTRVRWSRDKGVWVDL